MSDAHYRIATLIFFENARGEQLLLHRRQSPNAGLLSPIGGKLETNVGESPVECALREIEEEVGLRLEESELRLFGYLAERDESRAKHWMVYLFRSQVPISDLPPTIEEGEFGFYAPAHFPDLPLPKTDAQILWPVYLQNPNGFTGIRVVRKADGSVEPVIECEIVGE